MEALKRIAGIFILFFCGFLALFEVMFVQILMEEPKDYFSVLLILFILAMAVLIFLLVCLGLRLIKKPVEQDSIDHIGK